MGDGFEPDGTAVGNAAAEGQGFPSMGATLAPPAAGTPRAVPLAALAGTSAACRRLQRGAARQEPSRPQHRHHHLCCRCSRGELHVRPWGLRRRRRP